MSYKKCPVVMLATDKSSIYLHNSKMFNNKTTMHIPDGKQLPQNIYILSDDEIEVGDWVYDKTSEEKIYQVNILPIPKEYPWKKIIATTDRKLTLCTDFNHEDICTCNKLPQIPESFISLYIEQYNKSNKIEYVMVEYYTHATCHCDCRKMCKCDNFNWKESFMISRETNTISIKSIKDSWNKEELEILCEAAYNAGEEYGYESSPIEPHFMDRVSDTYHQWKTKNL